MFSAPHLTLDHVAASWQLNGSQQNWDTTDSEDSLNNEFRLVNVNSRDKQVSVDKFRIDGETPLSPNGHTIQAQPDTRLTIIEGTSPVASVEEEHVTEVAPK